MKEPNQDGLNEWLFQFCLSVDSVGPIGGANSSTPCLTKTVLGQFHHTQMHAQASKRSLPNAA